MHHTKIFCPEPGPEQLKTIVTSEYISLTEFSWLGWAMALLDLRRSSAVFFEPPPDRSISAAWYSDLSACKFKHSEPKDIRLHPAQTTLSSIMLPARVGLLSNRRIQNLNPSMSGSMWTHASRAHFHICLDRKFAEPQASGTTLSTHWPVNYTTILP